MVVNVLIRYRIRPDEIAAQEAAARAFIEEVRTAGDPEMEYSSFRLDDTSFVHFGRFADDDAVKRFQSLPGFAGFAAGMRERAEEGPDATRMTEIATTRA